MRVNFQYAAPSNWSEQHNSNLNDMQVYRTRAFKSSTSNSVLDFCFVAILTFILQVATVERLVKEASYGLVITLTTQSPHNNSKSSYNGVVTGPCNHPVIVQYTIQLTIKWHCNKYEDIK